MRFFEYDGILAFISDASIDFTPGDFDAPLSLPQQQYLKDKTDFDIPRVFWRKQVHGDDVVVIGEEVAEADGFVTNERVLAIAIRTADCVPVFVYDPVQKVVGLVHAGWKGTHKQIVVKTIQTMRDKFGCECYDLKVAIGPAIRACCYQVGPEFKGYFPQDVLEYKGHLYVDVVAANRRQMLGAGILEANITDSKVCTCCNTNYFSYRRQGVQSGRMISVMMLP